MSTKQYLRKISIIIGSAGGEALEFSEFRVRFAVRRGDTQTPNTASIRIYNLSDNTAQRIHSENSTVVLQAGYEGNFGVLFTGQIKQVRRGRESPTDTYVDVLAADGDSAYNYAVVSKTLAAGYTFRDQMMIAVEAMEGFGVGMGYMPPLFGEDIKLPRGKVFYGMARDYMRIAAQNLGANWSIQDGKVNVIPLTSYMPGDVPVINAASGMVGLPEQTINGINVKMLLNPSIKIGLLIHLNNASIQQFQFGVGIKQEASNSKISAANKLANDGYYYVMVAEHIGDTRGHEWYTHVICLATDASIPIGLSLKNTAASPTPDAILKRG